MLVTNANMKKSQEKNTTFTHTLKHLGHFGEKNAGDVTCLLGRAVISVLHARCVSTLADAELSEDLLKEYEHEEACSWASLLLF